MSLTEKIRDWFREPCHAKTSNVHDCYLTGRERRNLQSEWSNAGYELNPNNFYPGGLPVKMNNRTFAHENDLAVVLQCDRNKINEAVQGVFDVGACCFIPGHASMHWDLEVIRRRVNGFAMHIISNHVTSYMSATDLSMAFDLPIHFVEDICANDLLPRKWNPCGRLLGYNSELFQACLENGQWKQRWLSYKQFASEGTINASWHFPMTVMTLHEHPMIYCKTTLYHAASVRDRFHASVNPPVHESNYEMSTIAG